ncbi:hypothetical protein [Synechococcus sp. O70.1]|uniref:hypothetical protein n=1 Tax=Synechococcus sp. O70.1 TaxID=2964535 RepID=UPI0039C249CB
MYSLLLTYSLNPLRGLKLLVRSSEQASLGSLARQLWRSRQGGPRLQIALGRLVPEQTKPLSPWEVLLRSQFFIALEATWPDPSLPALPSGQGSAIQLARYTEGSQPYKTEIIRFSLGGSPAPAAPRRYSYRRRRF